MTQLHHSGSVPMNRNYPKIKNSPNRRPQPSANTTRFTEPNFSTHTGNLIEVLYGHHHCNSRANITLLCTYFSANKRDNRFPYENNSFVKNETSNDNFYSDKRKLCATTVETETSNRIQQYDKGLSKINATLKDLGFVSKTDRMFTMYPSKINYYNVHKHNNTGYGPNSYNSPKPKNSLGNSDGYNQGSYQNPILSKTYTNSLGNSDGYNQGSYQNPILSKIYTNSLGNSDGYNQGSYQNPILSKTYTNSLGNSDGYKQGSYQNPILSKTYTNSLGNSDGYNQGSYQNPILFKTYTNSLGNSDGYNQGSYQKPILSKTYTNSLGNSDGYKQGSYQNPILSKTYTNSLGNSDGYNQGSYQNPILFKTYTNSLGNSDGYNQGSYQKPILSKTYTNSLGNSDGYNQGSYQNPILSKTYTNSLGNSDGYNQGSYQKPILSKTYTNSLGNSDGYNQGSYQNAILSKTYTNSLGNSDGYKQGSYQNPILSKTYTNSLGNSDGYNQGSYQKPILSKTYTNSLGNSDGYNQGSYQNAILSKTYTNSLGNSDGYNQGSYQNPILSKTYTNTSSNQLDCSKKTNHFHQNKQCPNKYWAMRYLLFSKFDHGILLDTESFYSVCPEVLSYHIAKRCRSNIVCDPFCGAGGNIIQLALTCKRVIAIDIDPNKIKLARHNAEIYGVAHKIEFIVGDFFLIYPMLKADVVFMSPPWGGPEYSNEKSFSITSMCNDHFRGGFGIFDIVKTIAPNIAFHMPKNTNISECMLLAKDFGKVEIQQNIINGRLNSITAFYGKFY